VSHYRPPKTQYASPEEWEREVNRMTQDQKRRTNMVRAKFHLSEVHARFVFKPQYDTLKRIAGLRPAQTGSPPSVLILRQRKAC
jgi:hypothetical protein